MHLWLLDSRPPAPGQGLLGVLSQQQLQQCTDSRQQQLQRATAAPKASDLHRSVFVAVRALPANTWQQPPVLEQHTADGALSIDISGTTRSGVQLAIEVDGPSHFVKPDGKLTGPTMFPGQHPVLGVEWFAKCSGKEAAVSAVQAADSSAGSKA